MGGTTAKASRYKMGLLKQRPNMRLGAREVAVDGYMERGTPRVPVIDLVS